MTRVLFAIALLTAWVAPAGAATSVATAVTTSPSYIVCPINSSSAVNCKLASGANPTTLVGVFNGSSSAQTISVACSDGTNTYKIGPLGIDQGLQFPSPGFPLYGLLTCTPTAAPTDTIYILIY
jgi:hypothetical protein